MTSGLKWTLGNIAIYAVVIFIAVVVDHFSPAGPCVPGAGMYVLLAIPFLALLLFILTLIGRIKGDKVLTGPLLVNTLVLLCIALIHIW